MNIYKWRGKKKIILVLLLTLIALIGVIFVPDKPRSTSTQISGVQAEK